MEFIIRLQPSISASPRNDALCQGATYAAQQIAAYSITSSANREQLIWNGEAERLSGLELEDKLKLSGKLDRKIGRLLSPEDAVE